MTIIDHSTDDALRLFGMRHFMETQGLPETTSGKPPVGIVYGDQKSGFANTVRVIVNDIGTGAKGRLSYDGIKSPLYEVPRRLEGDPLASFSGEEDYPCVVENGDEIVIGFDVFNEVGRLLSGYFEDFEEPGGERDFRSVIPVADFYGKILFDCLLNAYDKADLPLVRKAHWPDGRDFAVCLTHDVDEVRKNYQHLTRPIMYAMRGNLVQALKQIKYSITDFAHGRNPYWTFKDLMGLEEELGVRSSFYFLDENAKVKLLSPSTWKHHARRYDFNEEKVKELIGDLCKGGWDVGIHGSYESYNNKEMLGREKKDLESISGPTQGTRQHHLNLCFPDTWCIQESCKLSYDTSLGFKDTVGFRWGTCQPFNPLDTGSGGQLKLLEIPLTIMDVPLMKRVRQPQEVCMQLMDAVQRHNGVLNLLWHPPVFNDREFPGYTGVYRKLIVAAKERGAWVTHAADIARWWNKRKAAKLNVEADVSVISITCPRTQDMTLEVFDGWETKLIKPDAEKIRLGGKK